MAGRCQACRLAPPRSVRACTVTLSLVSPCIIGVYLTAVASGQYKPLGCDLQCHKGVNIWIRNLDPDLDEVPLGFAARPALHADEQGTRESIHENQNKYPSPAGPAPEATVFFSHVFIGAAYFLTYTSRDSTCSSRPLYSSGWYADRFNYLNAVGHQRKDPTMSAGLSQRSAAHSLLASSDDKSGSRF